MTASELFAACRGVEFRTGPHTCYYCLARCDDSYSSAEFVKSSFTSRDTVGCGDYVCAGCVAAMNEKSTITLANGEVRENQKIRCYSWVLSGSTAIAATKAHRDWLLRQCLVPPRPPFAIVISDSGQKHLLYRGRVSRSRDSVVVTLEGEQIIYSPDELQRRLQLCKRVAAAIGKPGLSVIPRPSALAKLIEHHSDESLPETWLKVREMPLTRLAIWFTPAKKECEIEYPITR
jgi:CRISPR type IV-associated protein Csf1